jgi:hypothetical protein
MTAVAVVLVFAGGFCAGGLALYTAVSLVMSNSQAGRSVVYNMLYRARLSHWIDVTETPFSLVCPRCKHANPEPRRP